MTTGRINQVTIAERRGPEPLADSIGDCVQAHALLAAPPGQEVLSAALPIFFRQPTVVPV